MSREIIVNNKTDKKLTKKRQSDIKAMIRRGLTSKNDLVNAKNLTTEEIQKDFVKAFPGVEVEVEIKTIEQEQVKQVLRVNFGVSALKHILEPLPRQSEK